MRLVDTASEALRSIRPGRTRGAMAVLGIVLCIAAVVGLASVLGGVREAYVGKAAQSRARLVSVSTAFEGGMGASDVRAMGRELSGYFETVSPSTTVMAGSFLSTRANALPAVITIAANAARLAFFMSGSLQ